MPNCSKHRTAVCHHNILFIQSREYYELFAVSIKVGPIEAGNDIFQILMILCVHVGLVIGTTLRVKISPNEIPLPWQP